MLVIRSVGRGARVLPAMGQLVSVVVFPGYAPCAICGQAVGDRILEGLVVCPACAQALARPPAPSWDPLEQPTGPTLAEIVDVLVRSTP